MTGSRASEPIITGSSTIKNTNKVEIINNGTNGQTAQSITYTPPAGKGYFYQTAQGGTKLHTRKAISGTTPYLCIEPDTLYTLTLPEGVTAKTNGISDTSFYAGETVTVTAPQDTETKKFEKWTGGENITEADPNWQTSKKFTFEMPTGNVSLSAEYRKTYLIYETAGVAEFFVDGKQVNQAPAGVRVTVKLVDGFNNDHREFDQWQPGVGTALVDPEEGWKHKPSFSFTMPEGDVELQAHTTSLYDVNVTHGTIVDGTGDTGTSQKIVKPGQLVTVRAESTEENPFLQWTYTGKA